MVLTIELVVLSVLSAFSHAVLLYKSGILTIELAIFVVVTVVYSAVTLCYCSNVGALCRVVSFEACCQWARIRVQITKHYPSI